MRFNTEECKPLQLQGISRNVDGGRDGKLGKGLDEEVWSLLESRWQMRDQEPGARKKWRLRSTELRIWAGCTVHS